MDFIGKNFERDRNEEIFYKDNLQIAVAVTGVGVISTAYHVAGKIALYKPDLCVQVGVAGAFNKELDLGEVVWVKDEMWADWGVEDHTAFTDVFDIGLVHPDEKPFTGKRLVNMFPPASVPPGMKEVSGLTVNTVSGSLPTIEKRSLLKCDVESMEGAAFHYVCLSENCPFLQVRGISNYVEPRNRESWKMAEAVTNINNWLISYLPYHY